MAKDHVAKQRLDAGDKESKKAKNPYIQVKQTESGHTMIFDDTPENPRIFFAHESGSYIEMTTNGKVVTFAVGDSQNYNKGGTSFTVDENQDIKIHGHSRIVAGGGSYVEVAGHAGIGVAGDTTLFSKGNLNAHVDNFYVGAKGNFKINAEGNMQVDIKGDMTTKVAGNQSTEVGGDRTQEVSGSKDVKVGADITQKSATYAWDAETTVKGNIGQEGIHTDSLGKHS